MLKWSTLVAAIALTVISVSSYIISDGQIGEGWGVMAFIAWIVFWDKA